MVKSTYIQTYIKPSINISQTEYKRIPRKLKKLARKSYKICTTNDCIVLWGADYNKNGIVFEYSYGYRKQKFKTKVIYRKKVLECYLKGILI